MKKNIFVIIMAAGSGSRMGAAVPKQFLELGGKPILQLTIEKFVRACPDIKVVTVLPKNYISEWKNICSENSFYHPQILVEGGITRFHSVKNALEKIPDGAVVAIHDGVRPLISEELIVSMFKQMENTRALIPVLPSVDTLKAVRSIKSDDGSEVLQAIPGRIIDRSEVYRAQTPQIFLSEEIKKAYQCPFSQLFTDDASVAEENKIPLSFVKGERYNIKITTKDDLDFAKAILSMKL